MTRSDERLVRAFDRLRESVVANENCSGCGACVLLDASLQMEIGDSSYCRPVRRGRPAPVDDAAKTFDQVCPGRRVRSPRPPGASIHPILGPVIGAYEAWAADTTVRHRGSSGGALTALTGWLVETGEIPAFAAVRADAERPRRTIPLTIASKEDALASAGSRYAPVSVLAGEGALTRGGIVGKPCEISAARALTCSEDVHERPLLLSFFCAGTPSQHATDQLVEDLGVPPNAELAELWYRGRGWPGRFTAVPVNGPSVSTTYDESWGEHLGRATQWRCKICPDGVGESSDISAADFWQTDSDGYPLFVEGDGSSAILARTPRGDDVLRRAFAEGVLIGRPLDLDQLAAVQPLQVSRRRTLLGRLTGAVAAGRKVPRFIGFGLTRLAITDLRTSLRTARGSHTRVRHARTR